MDNRGETDVVFEYTGVGCSVPKDVISVRIKDGLQTIVVEAFYKCTSLESITLPSTVTEIGDGAFHGCSDLEEVRLNDGLKKIGDGAFSDCTSLECITLPSTLVEIGNYAFFDCSNLKEVILNDGLQKIGLEAFHCTSLESVTLPSTLVDIDIGAFYGCRNLRDVELNWVPQYLKSGAFLHCEALERFLFPAISYRLENIIQTNHWEDFEDKLNEVRGVVQWEDNILFVSAATATDHNNWNETKRDFGKITRLVSYYELKDATTTFELALWKSKLDQAGANNSTNRAAYRIDVPGPAKDTMLQYLDHI